MQINLLSVCRLNNHFDCVRDPDTGRHIRLANQSYLADLASIVVAGDDRADDYLDGFALVSDSDLRDLAIIDLEINGVSDPFSLGCRDGILCALGQ